MCAAQSAWCSRTRINQIVANVVEDDVAFAPENLGVAPEEIRRRVDAALGQVGMYELRQHAPHLLSGGQKQRVAIAGVIAMEPEIIVLDEPTAMLDPQGRREVISTVTRLCREKGMTVVLITHHMDECVGADRLIIMSNGSIVSDGTPEKVFADARAHGARGADRTRRRRGCCTTSGKRALSSTPRRSEWTPAPARSRRH